MIYSERYINQMISYLRKEYQEARNRMQSVRNDFEVNKPSYFNTKIIIDDLEAAIGDAEKLLSRLRRESKVTPVALTKELQYAFSIKFYIYNECMKFPPEYQLVYSGEQNQANTQISPCYIIHRATDLTKQVKIARFRMSVVRSDIINRSCNFYLPSDIIAELKCAYTDALTYREEASQTSEFFQHEYNILDEAISNAMLSLQELSYELGILSPDFQIENLTDNQLYFFENLSKYY